MTKPNKTLSMDFNSFKGICLPQCHSGKESISDIVNFHITENGSVKKRSGYRHILSSEEKAINTVWSGKLRGAFKCYAVIANVVYEINLKEKSKRYIGTLTSSGNSLCFFCYKDNLYIKDTEHFYLVTDSYIKLQYGFVPLLGKDWGTTLPGEIHQPLNLMNRYARISYKISATYTNLLPTLYPVKSILSVYRNGIPLPEDEYYFDANLNTINIKNGVSEGQYFLVAVEFKDNPEPYNEYLKDCSMAQSFGKINDFRVFAWGAKSKSSHIFASSHVSDGDLSDSESLFSGYGELYFKKNNSFCVGDGSNSVTAVSRHYDRLLIFTDGDVWMANAAISEAEDLPVISINSTAGCASQRSNVMAGNDPVTVSKNSILKWTSQTDEINDCNAYSISGDINEKLNKSFFENAVVHKNLYKNELWFLDPSRGDIIWIYNINNGSWVRFTGMSDVLGMFDSDGNVGFYTKNDIFIFDDSLRSDYNKFEEPINIEARLESGILDFDTTNQKRLTEAELVGDLNKKTRITLSCDTGEKISFEISDNSEHSITKLRVRSGRFKTARLLLTAHGDTEQTIHRIRIKAKEK